MSGTEDPPPSSRPGEPGRAGSWSTVLAIAVGSFLVAGAVAWTIVPKGAPDPAPRAMTAPSNEPTRQAQPARPAETRPEPYDGPPKITVQLGESKTEDCPASFTQSIVVRVYKGEADRITAVAKIPVDKVTRTRELFEMDSEWSTMVGALPTKRTINLLVIARGPGGKATVGEDISHPCPGEPMDERDPTDLSTKQARKKMRDKMFADDYEFDFDFQGKVGDGSGQGDKSGEPADR